jgi:hypothetical protein
MVDFQDSKNLVVQFFEELEAAPADDVAKVMNRYMSSDYQFRGVHPFNELEGVDAVAEALWTPLLNAFTQIQRRQDIFMAGTNEIDGTEWVTSMGISWDCSTTTGWAFLRPARSLSFPMSNSIELATARYASQLSSATSFA